MYPCTCSGRLLLILATLASFLQIHSLNHRPTPTSSLLIGPSPYNTHRNNDTPSFKAIQKVQTKSVLLLHKRMPDESEDNSLDSSGDSNSDPAGDSNDSIGVAPSDSDSDANAALRTQALDNPVLPLVAPVGGINNVSPADSSQTPGSSTPGSVTAPIVGTVNTFASSDSGASSSTDNSNTASSSQTLDASVLAGKTVPVPEVGGITEGIGLSFASSTGAVGLAASSQSSNVPSPGTGKTVPANTGSIIGVIGSNFPSTSNAAATKGSSAAQIKDVIAPAPSPHSDESGNNLWQSVASHDVSSSPSAGSGSVASSQQGSQEVASGSSSNTRSLQGSSSDSANNRQRTAASVKDLLLSASSSSKSTVPLSNGSSIVLKSGTVTPKAPLVIVPIAPTPTTSGSVSGNPSRDSIVAPITSLQKQAPTNQNANPSLPPFGSQPFNSSMKSTTTVAATEAQLPSNTRHTASNLASIAKLQTVGSQAPNVNNLVAGTPSNNQTQTAEQLEASRQAAADKLKAAEELKVQHPATPAPAPDQQLLPANQTATNNQTVTVDDAAIANQTVANNLIPGQAEAENLKAQQALIDKQVANKLKAEQAQKDKLKAEQAQRDKLKAGQTQRDSQALQTLRDAPSTQVPAFVSTDDGIIKPATIDDSTINAKDTLGLATSGVHGATSATSNTGDVSSKSPNKNGASHPGFTYENSGLDSSTGTTTTTLSGSSTIGVITGCIIGTVLLVSVGSFLFIRRQRRQEDILSSNRGVGKFAKLTDYNDPNTMPSIPPLVAIRSINHDGTSSLRRHSTVDMDDHSHLLRNISRSSSMLFSSTDLPPLLDQYDDKLIENLQPAAVFPLRMDDTYLPPFNATAVPYTRLSVLSSDDLLTTNLRTVLIPYVPELEDELALAVGDLVHVEQSFNDNWAVGKNLSTHKTGCFPLVCFDKVVASSIQSAIESNNNSNNNSNSSSCGTLSYVTTIYGNSIYEPRPTSGVTIRSFIPISTRASSFGYKVDRSTSDNVGGIDLGSRSTIGRSAEGESDHNFDNQSPFRPSMAPTDCSTIFPGDGYQYYNMNTDTYTE